MSLVAILDNLLIAPLLVIYEVVFKSIFVVVESVGGTLVWFSVVLNLVLLPIYYEMERAGRAGAQRREQMNKEVARIKAHYRGRERYFYIQTVYRQFGYRPITVVLSSADLYLQILVFATVYRFLATHKALAGTSFLSIADLSRPDGLLFGANVLPILMTLLNVLSALLHSADKTKRRNAFVFAAVFLALLYASPSGLVLYWTCNNAFSLVRNLTDRALVPLLPSGVTRLFSRVASEE